MEALKNSEIFCSTRLSKVELHALATLAVPTREGRNVNNVVTGNKQPFPFVPHSLELLVLNLTYHIGEDEVPPGDEGPDFSNCHIAVKIRRARLGDTSPKLGVAQPGQHGGQSGDEEAEDNSRSCLQSGDLASQDVDTGAESGAHPQGD